MPLPAVPSAVSRSFRYFDGVRFKQDGIHLRRPRARVELNKAFFKSAFAAANLYAYVVALRVSRIFRGVRHKNSVAFYPQAAAPWYNIWLVTQFAPIKISSDLDRADFVFAFEDETHVREHAEIENANPNRLINHRVKDISKSHVAEIFYHTFGYDLEIDPAVYHGKAVCKSEANGAHDGVVVDCPLARNDIKSGFAYQKLIDSTFNGRTSEDLRISYVFGEIPVVFHKHKEIEKRFGTEYLSVDVRGAEDVFSDEEIKNIAAFCEAMGLDFGSVDIMRDKNDGRIYVVDVNKTCMPVLCLSLEEQNKAMRKIADAFSEAIADRLENR